MVCGKWSGCMAILAIKGRECLDGKIWLIWSLMRGVRGHVICGNWGSFQANSVSCYTASRNQVCQRTMATYCHYLPKLHTAQSKGSILTIYIFLCQKWLTIASLFTLQSPSRESPKWRSGKYAIAHQQLTHELSIPDQCYCLALAYIITSITCKCELNSVHVQGDYTPCKLEKIRNTKSHRDDNGFMRTNEVLWSCGIGASQPETNRSLIMLWTH